MFLTSKWLNNTSFSEKVVLSESGEKSAKIEHRLKAKNSPKQFLINMFVDFERQQEMEPFFFLLEEALLWIMDSYFGQKWQFEVTEVH